MFIRFLYLFSAYQHICLLKNAFYVLVIVYGVFCHFSIGFNVVFVSSVRYQSFTIKYGTRNNCQRTLDTNKKSFIIDLLYRKMYDYYGWEYVNLLMKGCVYEKIAIANGLADVIENSSNGEDKFIASLILAKEMRQCPNQCPNWKEQECRLFFTISIQIKK